MGVVVGRVISIDGLCIVNFNRKVVFIKNLDVVYEFYDRYFLDFLDMFCCSKYSFYLSIDINVLEDIDDGLNLFFILIIVIDLGIFYYDEELL